MPGIGLNVKYFLLYKRYISFQSGKIYIYFLFFPLLVHSLSFGCIKTVASVDDVTHKEQCLSLEHRYDITTSESSAGTFLHLNDYYLNIHQCFSILETCLNLKSSQILFFKFSFKSPVLAVTKSMDINKFN